MSGTPEHDPSPNQAARPPDRRRTDLTASWAVFRWLVVTATTWFLLKELAPVLRPLLLAIFLAYVILPMHLYVRGQARGGIRHLAVLVVLVLGLTGIGVLICGEIVDLSKDISPLHHRLQNIAVTVTRHTSQHMPWLSQALTATASAETQGADWLGQALGGLVNWTFSTLVEGLQVVFFLTLILVEAGRAHQRIRGAFANEQAEQVLATVGSINEAIASFLKAKVKASFALALPVVLVLYVCGIRHALLWGALTFFANFIPYLGSVIACTLPIVFGFLDMDFGWQPVVAAVLLVAVHTLTAYLIEPAMTGKAVNLSPLVVLIALCFWGLCWGLVGMVLAVPLTAMLKIILQSRPGTRPIARLIGEE